MASVSAEATGSPDTGVAQLSQVGPVLMSVSAAFGTYTATKTITSDISREGDDVCAHPQARELYSARFARYAEIDYR